MRELRLLLNNYLRGVDFPLLGLCLAASALGLLLISSACAPLPSGAGGYVRIQAVSVGIGVCVYLALSAARLETLISKWRFILPANILIILLLLTPLGTSFGSQNRSWLLIPGLPFSIQPAEIAKAGFILLLAAQFHRLRASVNNVLSIASFIAHTFFMVALIQLVSGDTGVALIYVAILIVMMVGALVRPLWFIILAGAAAAGAPLVWAFLSENQRSRVLIVLNPRMDPQGAGWHTLLSVKTINNGGPFGRGLYRGEVTQSGDLFAAHTDFIFSVCGEELGQLGCLVVLLLLTAIIARCFTACRRARGGPGALVAFGAGGMLLFQVFENIGMCLGLTPVIGITLPFLSYGGSSNIALYSAMGLVSAARSRRR
ncbi:MAG: FtsW/RodA/SpoVE family cell cycle protein [Oscillospiraceae bacterium]|jgi:rod shape determining protein RodA|nr:FtsW/RodA/SpoVE family cell cycle protein [Oscillospiraceae bacterium]